MHSLHPPISITSKRRQNLAEGSNDQAQPTRSGALADRLPDVPGLPRRRPLGGGSSLPPRQRLVVASNRMPSLERPAAGGVAAMLGGLMKQTCGQWVCCSDKIDDNRPDDGQGPTQPYGLTTLVPIDLSQAEHDNYYAGFANKVLWPVFHGQVKRAEFKAGFFESYEQVNKRFAARLAALLAEDDLLWVHDYHLIPLAEELRRLGCAQRMGFFSHIPFPAPEALAQIPQHEQLVRALFSYDLVGMQIRRDLERFHEYVEIRVQGRRPDEQHVQAFGRTVHTQHFPIGIDVAQFTSQRIEVEATGVLPRLRRERRKRILMVAAERMDYTKGLTRRLKAFRLLLERHPGCRRHVTLAQIVSPSRETVAAYVAVRDKVRRMVDDLNNDYGSRSWTPVLHFEEVVDRRAMPEVFRLGRVGLVTPVADGMNLVAKEYVAAQDPLLPGTLVLSRGAGASEQLAQALMVDPGDPAGMAEMFHRALHMPLEQRRERHAALLKNVQDEDLQWWRDRYLDALEGPGLPPRPADTPGA